MGSNFSGCFPDIDAPLSLRLEDTPERFLAFVLMCLDPPDICMLARLDRAFTKIRKRTCGIRLGIASITETDDRRYWDHIWTRVKWKLPPSGELNCCEDEHRLLFYKCMERGNKHKSFSEEKAVFVIEENQEGNMDPIVSAATENVLNCGVEIVKRRMGYLFCYKDKVEELNSYVKNLNDARERVQHQVETAKNNNQEIEGDVQHWLKDVDEKITEVRNFLGDGGHAGTGCSISLFPKNMLLRYRLGRKATKMVEKSKADELLKRTFDRVSYQPGPSMDVALSNIGYESFVSRDETMERIMKALKDSTVKMIGVYGAAGVGKTTLVKEVAKKARENNLFNLVVMANITRNPDIKKIQEQFAEMLGMRLEEESEIVRAGHLRKRLKKEKDNTLIILDDLWDGLDLNTLGIPYGGGSDDDDVDVNQKVVKNMADFSFDKMEKEKSSSEYKGCKILLTSRRKEVLCSQMDVKDSSTFSVGLLEEKEAVTLLKKVAGMHDKDSQFEGIAIEIAKMCAGLPIAIVSIGRALKNKSSFVWEDVCQQLKRQTFTGGQESIEFSIKLSYDHLKNEELKSIFLLCARMGNDPLIMDLVKFCIGLGMLHGVHTIREARHRVNVLIEELKESSLLVESYSNDRFNMHDIVRDVALSISSKEKHVFTMKNGKLDEWPHKDELERYTVISLHYCDIVDELPESIYCPRLQVFYIDSNDPSMKIPDKFFEGMTELRVLILTGFNLSWLPSSIKSLVNLRMLCLERCTLRENLSVIGELKKLRIFTLSGSNIEKLPVELGQLSKLQLFDLSNCSKLRVIPSNIISRLNNLEELYMTDDLILWAAEDQRNQTESASLSELRHLNKLRTLEIHIPNVACLPQNLFFDKLDCYKIVIGEFDVLSVGRFVFPDKLEALKGLALQLKNGSDIHSENGIKMLFKRVEKLLLGELNGVHDVLHELNVEGFPNLKRLTIANNFGIQYIINSLEQLHPFEAFPNLQSMWLYKLENMQKICNNQLSDASFGKLKFIKIETCGQLRSLFSFVMVRLLTELETIEVCDCDSLMEIVSIERQVNIDNDVKDCKIEFPQLRYLILESLPAFTGFYTNGKMASITESYKEQVPYEEPAVISTEPEQGAAACLSLFDEKVSLPKLESLELSSINIQKIWSDQCFPNHCFQNLLTLIVINCDNLNFLLSLSMAESLVNLQSLFVSGCERMENIFNSEDARHIDIFPRLREMEISCMENLDNIWHPHTGLHSFCCLDSLKIDECHNLVTVFPGYMREGFRSLQTLVVTNCKLVENIFDLGDTSQADGRNYETKLHNVLLEELPNLVHVWKAYAQAILTFNNLQNVHVKKCGKIDYLFPLSIAHGLQNLEILLVHACWGMKEIIARDEGSNGNTIMFKFPRLTAVSFIYLFEIRSFCQGAHTLEWPSLVQLNLFGCNKLEALITKTTRPEVEPFCFATKKVISNWEYLGMSLMEAMWQQDYIVSVHRMNKLKSLMLEGLKNTEILSWLLHRIPNLESLYLLNSPCKEVWATGSLTTREKIGTVLQLKELNLMNCMLLQKIGFEHGYLLQRVERLVINICPFLINLAPSSVSFNNLTFLEVKNCNRLRYLMAASTAKSLVQLTTMKVIQCQVMTGIIAEGIDKEEKAEDIDFKQLKALELVSLQSLASFCNSENFNLKFPLLEKLVVRNCLLMETFSHGVKSTPNLQKVCVVEEKDVCYWEGDLNATIQKIFIDKVFFKYSNHLILSNHLELKKVWHGKIALPDMWFCNLKTLVVENCGFLKDIVIPSNVLPYLKSLEDLQVRKCNAVRVIFDIKGTEMKKTKRIALCLKKLTLDQLPNLKRVWNKNPQGVVSFPNLREVSVEQCGSLKSLLPASVARNIVKLKKLNILDCDVLVEIIEKEDASAHGSTGKFVFEFPCLTSLQLLNLPQLSCFYPGRHRLECPSLDDLGVSLCSKVEIFTTEFPVSTPSNQPLFLLQKVIPNLKRLTLDEKNYMIMLSNEHLSSDLLHKLNCLHLLFADVKAVVTLPFGFLQMVPNLEDLRISHWAGLKEIFPSQKLQAHNGIFMQLKTLVLYSLHKLNQIGLEQSWVKPYCEKLERLYVHSCSGLKKLVYHAVSFSSLKELEVRGCRGLKCLFTYSTAKSLVHLEALGIEECESIKEIVTKGDESASDELIFARLKGFSLISLPKLVCFYSGIATLQFPHLLMPVVTQCPNLETFSQGVINAPMFKGIQASLNLSDIDFDFHFCNDLNTTVERCFQEKVAKSACDIQHLNFGDHPKLEEIWLGVVPIPTDCCFNNLKSLIVFECETLSNVIPFHLLPFLCNLKEIEVSNCESVKAIFEVKNTRGDRQMINMERASLVSLPLKKLTLNELPNLEYIWNLNPDGILDLQNLQEVYVDGCKILQCLFPTSIANHLVKLDVQDCEGLVEIFAEDETALDGASKHFVFHCLSSLTLWNLPELEHFYPGKHQLEWPMLKKLDVYHCSKLKLFPSHEQQSCGDVHLEDQHGISIDQQALSSGEKVFPNLEELSLTKEGTMMIWQGQFQVNLHKLQYLELQCFHDESDIFPYEFLQKVPNIETLAVTCCSFREIFSGERLDVDYIGVFSQLKELQLNNLSKLNSIGLEHSWVEPFLERIQFLKLWKCHRLKKLVPSTVSFSNLTNLSITKCNGLVYLFTPSTAKSLGLLEEMSIDECKSIQEIVATEEDHKSDQDKIIFRLLNTVCLSSLPRLVSFYPGSYKLECPSLEEVSVSECPSMRIFCQGDISAPQMPTHPNTLIQNIFQETVQHLELADHPELEELWLGVVPISTSSCFDNLKSLMVVKCEFLFNVIPFHLLPFLCNLKEMEVSNCESVRAIFDVKDSRGDRQMTNMEPASLVSLPLKKLTLNELPNLEHIWNMNPDGILSLQGLQEVYIDGCRSLKCLFQTSVANHLVKLDVQDCEGLVEIFAEDKTALDGASKHFVLHCLSSLTLWNLPELKHFYAGKHQLEWLMLKKLDVYHCGKLKLFSTHEQQSCGDVLPEDQHGISIDQQAIFSVEKIFPNLEELSLTKEDVRMIWGGEFQGNLHKLKLLELQCFHDESDIFPCEFLQKVPNIKTLQVSCSSFMEIFSSERPDMDYIKVLSQLKRLNLYILSELSSIGLEHSWVEPFVKSLQFLKLWKCHSLKKLVPSTVSFSNLASLSVSKCHGLVYLFTSSTAKSLGLLKKMSIDECESIEEIVAKEEDHESDQDKIIFRLLNTVSLASLPRLVGFYMGSYKLECPSLKQVLVNECPSMRIFCQGDISAPQMPSHPNTLIQ